MPRPSPSEGRLQLRDWLRDLRGNADLSPAKIAEAIGGSVDERMVKRWLAERPTEPRGLHLLQFLSAVGVTVPASVPSSPPAALNAEMRELRERVEQSETRQRQFEEHVRNRIDEIQDLLRAVSVGVQDVQQRL